MWAIVPIKTFDRAKQRLANVLSEDERRSLMLAMARDVLTSLSRSSYLTGILIVSRASEADALAQAFATERFAESPGGSLADALDQATHHLITNFDADGVFVVPADVPDIQTSLRSQLRCSPCRSDPSDRATGCILDEVVRWVLPSGASNPQNQCEISNLGRGPESARYRTPFRSGRDQVMISFRSSGKSPDR